MGTGDLLLARLRSATEAEKVAIAKALDIKLEEEPEVALVRLADALRRAADEEDYRKILVAVAREVANLTGWKRRVIRETAEPEWIEEYIYQGLAFAERSDRDSLSDQEKAILCERAEQALDGKHPTPQQQADSALDDVLGIGVGVAVGLFLGWWAVAGAAGVKLAAWLFGPSMKKVVPATFFLIHARKRQEFEGVLAALHEAA